MTLIRSISGIRGTIGGRQGEALTPADVVKFTGAFATLLKKIFPGRRLQVVIGRDARVSGPMVSGLVSSTLMGCGIDVADIGLTTTPTAVAVNAHYHHSSITFHRTPTSNNFFFTFMIMPRKIFYRFSTFKTNLAIFSFHAITPTSSPLDNIF